MYQQWQFNDLTQRSQPDDQINLKTTAKLKQVKAVKNNSKIRARDVFCQDEAKNNSNTSIAAQEIQGTESFKITLTNGKQKGKRKAAKEECIHQDINEASSSPKLIRQKNYGKIRIMIKRTKNCQRFVPQIMQTTPFKIGTFERRKRKKLSVDIFEKCLDPFAFATISDQIKHLTPNEACLKVPHEFSVAKKQISVFEALWAHRTSEF